MSNLAFDFNSYRDELIKAGVADHVAEEVATKMAKAHELQSNAKVPEQVEQKQKNKTESELVELTPEAQKEIQEAKRIVYDYRNGKIPERVKNLIEAHLAIEAEDARSAGSIGFMTRALAIATMPHRRQNSDKFIRKNGDFTLTMLTSHPDGLPFGSVPRVLLTWVCTEAVKTQNRELNLGNSLAQYLNELGMHSTGGKRGDITRLKFQMTALFSSLISCRYEGKDSWNLKNVLLADDVNWWEPQDSERAGQWQTNLLLTQRFFDECIDHPIPVDMRAIKGLKQSPLAIDIYIWLTHRMSYLSKRTTIPWINLSGQFGSGYALNDQGLRDFRRAFKRELKHVLALYPAAKLSDTKNGLVLYPSPTHIPSLKNPIQHKFPLF